MNLISKFKSFSSEEDEENEKTPEFKHISPLLGLGLLVYSNIRSMANSIVIGLSLVLLVLLI